MNLYRGLLILAAVAGLAVPADLERGKELYRQGKFAEAAGELRQVVGENADNAEAQRLLGLSLLEQNKPSEAAEHLTKADSLASSGETKLALARLHVAQKDWDQADAAIKDASGDGLEYYRGQIRLNKQQYAEAAQDLETAIERDPQNAYAHYYAGLAYSKMEKPDKMLTHFEKFVQMKPDAPEARKVRAVLKTGR